MRTAGSTRRFMPGPVSDEVVYRVLDNARFAPSGDNRQGWRVIVVRDPMVPVQAGTCTARTGNLITPCCPPRQPPGHCADHLD